MFTGRIWGRVGAFMVRRRHDGVDGVLACSWVECVVDGRV